MSPIQFARNPVVIGLKYLSNAPLYLSFAEPEISGNGREFAQFDDRRLWCVVLEIVSQQRAQCRCAATHVPALPHHAFAANLFQAANVLAPRCLRRGSVIVLSASGGREERKTRHSGSQ